MAALGIALRSFLFWFGAIWLLAGALVARSGVAGLQAAQSGRSAEGSVVAKSIRPANRVDNQRTRYEVVYRFTVDGREYHRTAEVDVEEWEALTQGGPIRIFYLPDEFRTSRLDEPRSNGEIVAIFIGAIVFAAGGFLVIRELRRAVADGAAAGPSPSLVLPLDAAAPLLRGIWSITKVFAIVLVALLISELAPPVKNAAMYIDQRQSRFLPVAVGLAGIGFVLLMSGTLHLALSNGSSDTFSLDEMKAAWRGRTWRTSIIWRRRFLTAAGAALLILGIFGLIVVIGPPWVKLIAASAIIYAAARTAIGPRAN